MAKALRRPTPKSVPAARGLDAVKVVLIQKVPPNWRHSHTPASLIEKIEEEISASRRADQPAARIQRIAVLSTLALDLALGSNPNPPIEPVEEARA